MKCEYCGSEWKPSYYHPGTCAECGAPKPESELEKQLRPYISTPQYAVQYCCSTDSPMMLYKDGQPVFVGGEVISWTDTGIPYDVEEHESRKRRFGL